MPNGEDPKKPKANAEVKVTAKKQVEPPQKQYTWDDVSKNQEVKLRNKAVREKYESETANYNKAMKLYTQGPEDSNEPGMKLPDAKLAKGQTATFSKDTNRYTAEKMNKDLQQKIKSGQVVAMDDPSLDATTRKILAGIHGSGRSSDLYGTPGKRYVDKGTKVSSYKEVYGEDFNPEEFRAAGKSGNFEKYAKEKGYTGRAFTPKEGLGVYEEYGIPKQSAAPVYEKEESIDVRKLPPTEKLPLLKPGKIGSSDLKPLRMSESKAPAEKSDWQEPSGATKYRTKYSLPDVSTTNKAKSLGRFVKAKVESIGKDNALTPGLKKEQGKARLIQGKAGREGKMAKAYFSEYEGKSKNDIKGTLVGLKADKADFKSGIKEVRKGTAAPSTIDKSERIAGLRAAKKDVKAEMKQAKLASKYLGKLGEEYIGVREGQNLSSTGKIKTYTPSAMTGFSGSKQDVDNRDAKFNKFLAKSSTDNATNKNTIANQEKALSFKERVASDKSERQNAPSFSQRRAERKASADIQKAVMEKLKNK